MPTPRLADTVLAESARVFEECGRSWTEAAQRLGITAPTLRHRMRVKAQRETSKDASPFSAAGPAGDSVQTDLGERAGTVASGPSARITTLEQLLDFAQVDLDVWEVERHVVNKWEVGAKLPSGAIAIEPLIQVKAWLKRRAMDATLAALESLCERLEGAEPCYPEPPEIPAQHDCLLEISIQDHHFGALAWARETTEDYDLDIAAALYPAAAADLLAKARGYGVERILLPVGSDLLHADNLSGTTLAGTRQDMDTRLPKIIGAACESIKRAVDVCLSVAPVELLWVPGNHDRTTSYFLLRELAAWYSRTPQVMVDVGPRSRKYRLHGCCLIGWTHGDKEPLQRLPVLMADEVPELWAASTVREWHIGHQHRRGKARWLADEAVGSVNVRRLPSLCGTDAWHYEQGYMHPGQRAAEAYLWSRRDGYVGHFSTAPVAALLQAA